MLNFAKNFPSKKGFKKIINFWSFLLFCNTVPNIFTISFRGSEVCLERCDSQGNFDYLEKKQKKIILREFSKRTHCPAIGTLALLLFIAKKQTT